MELTTKHEKDTDKASKIWAALLQRAQESTDATINAQSLLEYIMTASIADWKGSTYDFVLNWEEQHCRFVAIVGQTEAIDPATLSRILRKVVRPIPALKNVEDTVNILQKGQVASGSTTTLTSQQKYDNYKQLLLEACQTYDAEAKTTRRRHRANCALMHKMQYGEDIDFDATTDVDTIQAFKSIQQDHHSQSSTQTIVPYRHSYNHTIEHQPIVPYRTANSHTIVPQGMNIGYPSEYPTYATYNHDLDWQQP